MPRPILDADLASFRQELEVQKRSPYTIKHYGLCVQVFHSWLSRQRGRPVPLRAAKPADLKQYQVHLTTRQSYKKNSLYATVKALQAFYRFLGTDAAKDLKAPRRGLGLPKYLTEAEATRLREAVAAEPRTHAVVALLLYTGLRVGELCRLTVTSLDFEELTIRVRSGKGDKDRLVVAAPRCFEILRTWLDQRPSTTTDYVFPARKGTRPITERTVQRLVRHASKAAGITKPVTPHVLRHTLATTLLRRGGDIRFIQRMLGHASIATTQVYTHLDDAELRRHYDRAQPSF